MRIISGKNKGRKLKTLEGMNTRPTADRVKESLFNILNNKFIDSVVLDLFAGSGALGLEALSRGANRCVFVDSSKEAIKIIQENIKACRFDEQSTVLNMDYLVAMQKLTKQKFDIIFVDPPYLNNIELVVLDKIKSLLLDDGILIIETDEKTLLPESINGLVKNDERKYGRTILHFYILKKI